MNHAALRSAAARASGPKRRIGSRARTAGATARASTGRSTLCVTTDRCPSSGSSN